jgi:hypothetical protein
VRLNVVLQQVVLTKVFCTKNREPKI